MLWFANRVYRENVRWKRPGPILTLGTITAFLYSNFLLAIPFSPPHDWLLVVSALEVPGHPAATLLRVTDVVCAILAIMLTVVSWAVLPSTLLLRATWCLVVVFAIGGTVAAFVPLPCASPQVCTSSHERLQDLVHDVSSIISAGALFLSAGLAALYAKRKGPDWIHRAGLIIFWVGGVVGTILFTMLGSYDSSSWPSGLAQRFQLVTMSIWLMCIAWWTAASVHQPAEKNPRAVRH